MSNLVFLQGLTEVAELGVIGGPHVPLIEREIRLSLTASLARATVFSTQ